MQSFELCCDMIDVVTDLSSIYRWCKYLISNAPSNSFFTHLDFFNHFLYCYSPDYNKSIDEQSGSIFKLNNGIILYLREIDQYLALVCILREYNFSRQGVIEYNCLCLNDAIHKIFAVRLSKKSGQFNVMNDDYCDHDGGNGSLINGNPRQSHQLTHRQSNSQLTKYLLTNKFRKIDE